VPSFSPISDSNRAYAEHDCEIISPAFWPPLELINATEELETFLSISIVVNTFLSLKEPTLGRCADNGEDK